MSAPAPRRTSQSAILQARGAVGRWLLRPVSPEMARRLDEARSAQGRAEALGPIAQSPAPAATPTAAPKLPPPLLPRAVPIVRLEPSPERVLGAIFNMVLTIINAANRRR
jgi:hypothetical protein